MPVITRKKAKTKLLALWLKLFYLIQKMTAVIITVSKAVAAKSSLAFLDNLLKDTQSSLNNGFRDDRNAFSFFIGL